MVYIPSLIRQAFYKTWLFLFGEAQRAWNSTLPPSKRKTGTIPAPMLFFGSEKS